jgi:hypothetical protein
MTRALSWSNPWSVHGVVCSKSKRRMAMDLENIADFKALQSNDSNEQSRLTRQRLSLAEITQLDELMLRTTVYYPNQELSADTFTEFRETMKELVADHGMAEVDAAVMAVRKRSEFFPHPAAVNKEIELRSERRQQMGAEERAAEYARAKQQQAEREHERIMASGGYCSMADVMKDFYERRKAKSAGPQPALPDGKTKGGAA